MQHHKIDLYCTYKFNLKDHQKHEEKRYNILNAVLGELCALALPFFF
jgi:hypothetical protein